VKFVLITATSFPSVSSPLFNQERQSKGRPPKKTMQNLLIVRDSMEKLGIFFEESDIPTVLVKGDLE
jgi:hypothetical protein